MDECLVNTISNWKRVKIIECACVLRDMTVSVAKELT